MGHYICHDCGAMLYSSEIAAQFMQAHTEAAVREARKIAKQENANDFTAIVQSFNRAMKANYDHYSMQNLRFVINNADARAKYSDLPVQAARLTKGGE